MVTTSRTAAGKKSQSKKAGNSTKKTPGSSTARKYIKLKYVVQFQYT